MRLSLPFRLGKRARGLDDRSGAAAVEFAIVAPVIIMLYLGGVDLTLAITCNQKVMHATNVVADLVAQSVKLTSDEISGFFVAADAVLQPYSAQPFAIRVSVLTIEADGGAKVAWSSSRGLTKRQIGSRMTLPAGLTTQEQKSLIIAESNYSYAPLTGFVVTKSIGLTGQVYARPRGRTAITCANC
ncbi:TadE/TadG family type IV pilus assembly protein [Aurantimonas sp. Leaf443]|uniref:TadE/TadG family type IV pilus assembly protein n=1 Tax=Aurantimonas sp. Leaf443 TaxID=1736378 RepID=UPI0006F26EC2|nr:TadE/TadG family type IV pilus assembly protein [Aurantimonas sp. Leaf443]KQT85764.1 hypothetical protein ASG48_03845 [Aurantimonas sp. Leaf443]